MGEARRRKLAGTYPARSQPLSRDETITWAMDALAATTDETISGVTIIPADGSDPGSTVLAPRHVVAVSRSESTA